MGGKGSGGSNKKSLEQHLRDGTYHRYRHGPLPEQRKTKATKKRQQKVFSPLPCPLWFDEYARREFERVCHVLHNRGTLQDVNHATLEGYCAAYSRAVRAEMSLNDGFETEITFYSKAGDPYTMRKKKTEVGVAEKAWGQVKVFAVELGITSSGINQHEDKAMSPLEIALQEAIKKPRNV